MPRRTRRLIAGVLCLGGFLILLLLVHLYANHVTTRALFLQQAKMGMHYQFGRYHHYEYPERGPMMTALIQALDVYSHEFRIGRGTVLELLGKPAREHSSGQMLYFLDTPSHLCNAVFIDYDLDTGAVTQVAYGRLPRGHSENASRKIAPQDQPPDDDPAPDAPAPGNRE